jgi:hypothetical protein
MFDVLSRACLGKASSYQYFVRLGTPCTEKSAPGSLLPQGASTEASSEFLADYAPQYVAGEFPKYLKRSQPFKNVPRL